MIIFKELYKAIDNMNYKLSNESLTTDEELLYSKQKNALEKVQAYLLSYDWLSHKKTKERVELFIKSGFDYRGCAEQLGIKLNAFETSMVYAGNKFKDKIGQDTLSTILGGQVTAGLLQYQIGVGELKLKSLIPSEIVSKLPPAKNDVLLSIEDCKDELELFKRIALLDIVNTMRSLDKDKFSFLRHILESTDSRHAVSRELIISYMLGFYKDVDEILKIVGNDVD